MGIFLELSEHTSNRLQPLALGRSPSSGYPTHITLTIHNDDERRWGYRRFQASGPSQAFPVSL